MKKVVMIALLVGLCAAAFAQSGNVTIPSELTGTWFRPGATSGRSFDTSLIVSSTSSGATLQWRYSDGRPDEVAQITKIEAVKATDQNLNTVAGKVARFPDGWAVDVIENGQAVRYIYLLNPARDSLTRPASNMDDVWGKLQPPARQAPPPPLPRYDVK